MPNTRKRLKSTSDGIERSDWLGTTATNARVRFGGSDGVGGTKKR